MDAQHRIETRDGMVIEWDAPIPMEDGVVLRADIFRPIGTGSHGVILSHGPYGKGLAFQDGYKSAWMRLVADHPEVSKGSSNTFMCWELADPEKWVPDGYACVRVDSRGAGRSPGFLDVWSPREARDYYQCIEWAAAQPWSNGKVGLNGVSYYAMNQWQVAALRPPHLAAMCAWEGASDYYRELARHGGILSCFMKGWLPRQVLAVQHGVGENGPRSRVTGEPVAGPTTLTAAELAANRASGVDEIAARGLIDDYYRARTPELGHIDVPLLSAANWGGQGLHSRGNFEGFMRAGSTHKWLEVHGRTHFSHFYSDYGLNLQKRFFGHFLQGRDTGWDRQPRALVNIRHPGEKLEARASTDWPLPETQWTKMYLDPVTVGLYKDPPKHDGTVSWSSADNGRMFISWPLPEAMEITGPVAAHLRLSSGTTDMDVFVVLRVFTPTYEEVVHVGASDPRMAVSYGWLRGSHRKLDPDRSKPWRPWHTHDEKQPLTPGVPVDLDIEIWPTSIVIPAGWHLGLSIRGRDYEVDGTDAAPPHAAYPMKGVGPFTHEDPSDRPPAIFDTTITLHSSVENPSYVLLPLIPASREKG
jgi:predicted acyl esterase